LPPKGVECKTGRDAGFVSVHSSGGGCSNEVQRGKTVSGKLTRRSHGKKRFTEKAGTWRAPAAHGGGGNGRGVRDWKKKGGKKEKEIRQRKGKNSNLSSKRFVISKKGLWGRGQVGRALLR